MGVQSKNVANFLLSTFSKEHFLTQSNYLTEIGIEISTLFVTRKEENKAI